MTTRKSPREAAQELFDRFIDLDAFLDEEERDDCLNAIESMFLAERDDADRRWETAIRATFGQNAPRLTKELIDAMRGKE